MQQLNTQYEYKIKIVHSKLQKALKTEATATTARSKYWLGSITGRDDWIIELENSNIAT